MAQQILNNGEQYGSIRTKINSMFSEVYSLLASLGASITSLTTSNTTNATNIATNTSNITALQNADIAFDTRVDNIELLNITQNNRLTAMEDIGFAQVGAIVPLASFTATITAAKLTYFDTITLVSGAYINPSIATQSTTIATTGIYKVFGNLILEFPQTDQISIQLYKNGVPITPAFHQQGLGAGKPVNIGYHAFFLFTAGDVLNLYAKSLTASFTCIVDGSAVSFERTNF